MAYEQQQGLGTIWKNAYKDSPSKPDFKTSQAVLVGDSEYDVALWERKKSNGEVYYSVKISPKFVKAESPAKAEPETVEEVDSDIPF